ncbi:hypothetical protein FGADI_10012 [Fusarium gaditjirri]|uniref:Uncharacterized protein n=1 Tax=Fusarium gaditjirri TaxID=282569 RepID=A0A8H4WRV7_9HYPO|nr:hypothetical protein FGADI_10012 [Fusarium gaditjirri]
MVSKRNHLTPIAILAIFLFFFFFNQYKEFAAPSAFQASQQSSSGLDWSRFAYTQYVTNSEYLCNSLMFFEALQRLGSRPDRVMMVPESMLEPEMVNSSDAYLLNKARHQYNVKLVPIAIQTNWAGDATWADSYTKLLAFNQTKYDRVLSIDSDSLLLQAMDELFFLPAAPVAMPRAYWISPEKILSSQLMLIQPSDTEFSRIMERVQSVKPGEYDMEIVNQLYGDSALIFPHRRYDLLSGEFRNDKHAHYLGSELETWDPAAAYSEAKLIHFSDWPLPKPWKPVLEEDRLAAQPNCSRTTSGEEDCTARIIWNSLYTDFRAKRNLFIMPSFKEIFQTDGAFCSQVSNEGRKVNSSPNHLLDPQIENPSAPSAGTKLHVTCLSSPDDKLDVGLVAPFGHIMCFECWPRKAFYEFDGLPVQIPKTRSCPVCQTYLANYYCQRTCDKEMMPTYGGKASVEAFPKTLLECRREFGPDYKDCVVKMN